MRATMGPSLHSYYEDTFQSNSLLLVNIQLGNMPVSSVSLRVVLMEDLALLSSI